MSGESFVQADVSVIKPLVQEILQRIYNIREQRRTKWMKSYYQKLAHEHRFWWNRHKLISEYDFITQFDVEKNVHCLWDRMNYYSCTALYSNQSEALLRLLALCDLHPNGQIHLSATDASMLGYPKRSSIPLSDVEQEKARATKELEESQLFA